MILGLVIFVSGIGGRRVPLPGGRSADLPRLCAGAGIFVLGLAIEKVRAAWRARRKPPDYQGPSQ
jgi:hypothetical protein